MSAFRTALVISAALAGLGLAGCQTTEERVYATEYREAPVVYGGAPVVYREDPTVTVRETVVYRDEPGWRRPPPRWVPPPDRRPREVHPPIRYMPVQPPARDWERNRRPPQVVEPFHRPGDRGDMHRPRLPEGEAMPSR